MDSLLMVDSLVSVLVGEKEHTRDWWRKVAQKEKKLKAWC
jgi:hypothetical protein